MLSLPHSPEPPLIQATIRRERLPLTAGCVELGMLFMASLTPCWSPMLPVGTDHSLSSLLQHHLGMLRCPATASPGSEAKPSPPASAGTEVGPVFLWCGCNGAVIVSWEPLSSPFGYRTQASVSCFVRPWHFPGASFISPQSGKSRKLVSCHFSGPQLV